jgi:hypothetical protein
MKAQASGLGQDAVIEIMIALLGIMIAVLTLIAGLFAAIVALLGVYGFQTIRDEATKNVGVIAKKTATKVASEIAAKTMDEIRERAQATGLTESQAEGTGELAAAAPPTRSGRTKATTDEALKKN